MSDPKNQIPLGDFTQRAATEGLTFFIKASIEAVKYDAAFPTDRDFMAKVINGLLAEGIECVGKVVQATLAAVVKRDIRGAEEIQKFYSQAMVSVGNHAAKATSNLVQTGAVTSRVVVASEVKTPAPAKRSRLKIVTD